jgi:AcrR family transcriptional regulator
VPRRSKVDAEQKILSAATEIILDQGIVGLRIRDVAERAAVSISMIYRRFTDRDGLLDATVANFYQARILRLVEQAQELAHREVPATVDDIIDALPMPDNPGSRELTSLMARVPALAMENEIFRQRIKSIVEEQLPLFEQAIRTMVSRLPSEHQFDPRLITILLLNQSWVYNELRGSRRVRNEEYQEFLRGIFTGQRH